MNICDLYRKLDQQDQEIKNLKYKVKFLEFELKVNSKILFVLSDVPESDPKILNTDQINKMFEDIKNRNIKILCYGSSIDLI